MNSARRIYEITIKATLEHVGEVITEPAFTMQYFHGTAADSDFELVIDGLNKLLETGAALGEVFEGERHRSQGIAANNGTWDWLAKPIGERTADDEEQMTLSADAAAYHWARAARSGPANTARANWLISRVWVVRGNGALALHYADIVLATCRANDLRDFNLAYAHESRARAFAALGRLDQAVAERATAAAVPMVDDEDRSILEADLAAESWFGLPVVPA